MTEVDDHRSVIDLLYSYTAAVDGRDWAAFQALFTEHVTWDFESLGSGPPFTVPISATARRLQDLFAHFTATHHAVTSPRATVIGDRAEIEARIRAEHWFDAEVVAPRGNCWLVVGFYEDGAVRTDAGWRLSSVRLIVRYEEGAHVNVAAQQLRDRAGASS